jgi:hypothetical protein
MLLNADTLNAGYVIVAPSTLRAEAASIAAVATTNPIIGSRVMLWGLLKNFGSRLQSLHHVRTGKDCGFTGASR